MATRIRLKRLGSKHEPHYRIAVMDQRSPRDGRVIEEIGYYNPRTDPATVEIKADRAVHWLSVGAQPSETVSKLFAKAGIGAAPEATAEEPAEQPTEEASDVEEASDAEE